MIIFLVLNDGSLSFLILSPLVYSGVAPFLILTFLCIRYAFPWWREKEIVSEEKRSRGLCPLTPEEMALVLQALGFKRETQIYIASGEIYGSERRLAALRAAFPRIVSQSVSLCLPV